MSTIRKQSIISSIIVYFGFALGFLNTYLFTREGGFSKEQYGLTTAFINIAIIMCSVANLGMPSYIGKFFPYYNARLDRKSNDMLMWSLLLSCMGFLFVIAFGFAFKNAIVERFSNSPELPEYFNWLFPFGFGLTLFMVLEAYGWQLRKAVVTNFLREVLFRLLVTVLIIFLSVGLIRNFDTFIKLYSFIYIGIALILLAYLLLRKKAALVFKTSVVTERFFNKIVTLCSFVWTGSIINNVAQVFDSIILMAVMPNGMAQTGIFTLGQFISNLLQAPQRGLIASSIGPLSQAWRDKDMGRISRIYHRSSINQLIFSTALFCLIWLNFEDGVTALHIQRDFLQAKYVFLFLGLTRIIDMGTGLNSQIIGTSTYWRFEFISGLVLLAFSLPLNYFLAVHLGLIGPAISNLIAFTIYNFIRYMFLWKKFDMQPFTLKSLYTILLAVCCFVICFWLFKEYHGFLWMIARSLMYIVLFVTGALLLKLSADVQQMRDMVIRKIWK